MKYHIVLSCNTAWNLYNFRGNLIRRLIYQGNQVTILAPPDAYSEKLAALGCQVVDLPMDNKGTHPWRDYQLMRKFKRIYDEIQPDIVLHYTIKPVIYGSLAARRQKIPTINTVTGLGTAFLRGGWLMLTAEWLYRISLRWPDRVIFQNLDDHDLFLDRKLVSEHKIECLPGSGVDLNHFSLRPAPQREATTFLLIARLLWDKGIGEFIEAARQLKQSHPDVRFQLLGELGIANPTAIPETEVRTWEQQGLVEYLGFTEDVRPCIEAADCIVLPSYREGSPRTLLEAAAMGRPVITTDVTGCRDVMEDEVTGFLCRAKDAGDLAARMQQFISLNPEQRHQMGLAGRDKMEREFDERQVIGRYLEVIDELLGNYTQA